MRLSGGPVLRVCRFFASPDKVDKGRVGEKFVFVAKYS